MILSGCSQIGGGYETEDRGEIVFTPMLDAATKAPVSSFANGNTLVVAATYEPNGNDPSSGARNYFPATTFTHNGASATSSGAYVRYWPLSSTGYLDFLAYAALGGTSNDVISSPAFGASNKTYAEQLTMSMSTNYAKQCDVLVGSKNAANSNNNAGIVFKHAQSYISFTATATAGLITITDIKLYQTSYAGNLTVTRALTSGDGDLSITWSNQEPKLDGVSIPGFSTTNLTTTAQSLGNIMVPKQASSGSYVIISYTLHNGSGADVNMQYKYGAGSDLAHMDGMRWDPSNQYVYNFNFNLNSITVTTSVNGWTTSNSNNSAVGI